MEVPSISFIFENSTVIINGILKGDGLSVVIGPTSDYKDILSIRVNYVYGHKKGVLTFDETSFRAIGLALKNPYSGCNLLAFFDNYAKGMDNEEKIFLASIYPHDAQIAIPSKSHHRKDGRANGENNNGNESNSDISIYQKIFNLFLIDLTLYLTTMSLFIEQQDLLAEPPSFTIPFGQLDSTIFYANTIEYMLVAAEALRGSGPLDQYYVCIINFANRWSIHFDYGPSVDLTRLQAELITLMAKNAIKEVKLLHATTTRDMQDNLGLNKVDFLISRLETLETKYETLEKKYGDLTVQIDRNAKLLEENNTRIEAIEKAVADMTNKSIGMTILSNDQATTKRVSIMKPVNKLS